MMRFLAILLLLVSTSAYGAWPYDACCNVSVPPYGGSGTLVGVADGRGVVLTCAHVIEGGNTKAITCQFPTFRSRGRLLGRDTPNDLAAIEIKVPDDIKTPVCVRPATREDTQLVIVGCPYYGNGKLYAMRARIAGFRGADALLAGEKLVVSGYSGGAVLTTGGEFIGVVWGHDDRYSCATSGKALTEFANRWLAQR